MTGHLLAKSVFKSIDFVLNKWEIKTNPLKQAKKLKIFNENLKFLNTIV